MAMWPLQPWAWKNDCDLPMPPDTKTRIEHELFLRSFSAVAPTARVMSQLSSLMQDEYFEKGATIFTRGAPAIRIYFIVAGCIEMVREGVEPWILEDESMIGVLDASRGRPYSRTAVAARPTHAVSLLFSDYLEVMEDNFDYTLKTMRMTTIQNNEIAMKLGNEAFEHLCEVTTPPLRIDHAAGDLDIPTRLVALHGTPMFAEAPVQALVTIAQQARAEHFARGAHVLSVGEPTTQLQLLVHGTARLQRRDAGIDALVAPTRILGGPAAFGYDESYFDVDAQSDITTLVIEREDLLDVMEDHFGLLRSFFALIATQRERLMQFSYAAGSVPPQARGMRS
jgi:CRP-like cAMP-binding protein